MGIIRFMEYKQTNTKYIPMIGMIGNWKDCVNIHQYIYLAI